MNPEKIAYLAQIQGVINRMASVTATCKGFTATIFAAVVAIVLSGGDSNRVLALAISLIPVLLFAFYDAYTLLKSFSTEISTARYFQESTSVDLDMPGRKSDQ